MSNGTIDLDKLVDSILSEKAGAASAAPPVQAEPPQPAEPAPAAESAPAARPAGLGAAAAPLIEEPPQPAKRRRRRRRSEAEPVEELEDWGLTPIGRYHVPVTPQPVETEQPAVPETPAEAVPAAEPPSPPQAQPEEPAAAEEETPAGTPAVDEFPAVQPVAETVTIPIPAAVRSMEQEATQVVPVVRPAQAIAVPPEQPAPQPEPPEPEQLPDQLSLEELVRVEDMADAPPAEDIDPEEQLRRTRQEKIRDFTLAGEEEETNEPEEESPPEPEEEPVIEDFTRYGDTGAVQLELQYRCRTALLAFLLTALLELVLLVLTFVTASVGRSPITEIGYLTVQVFALALMTVLNYAAVGRGLGGLFSLRANGDTAPALVAVTALIGLLAHFLNLSAPLPQWAPLAGLPLLLNAAAGWLRQRRVRQSFAFVSYPGDKYAAALIEQEDALRELGQRVTMDGDARVAYFRKTGFLTDYLHGAYADDAADDWARIATPVLALASLAASALLAVLGCAHGFFEWLPALMWLLGLSATSAALAVQIPLCRCSRHMLSCGGFLVSWEAVRRFGRPDALTVDAADLFPNESMLLHGIKTFAGTHIDDAILDAASLSIRAGGPLARIFRRIIQDKTELLHEVDSLVYEQNMGLSGWVDGRRVLVGNRRLLLNHGVDVPSLDYEARYAKNGRQLVYLSTAGELSAMFVVSYLPDESVQRALQQLCRAKVTVLVRSCDPNITAQQLCHCFDLDEYYVDILPAVAGRMYEQLVAKPAEETPAVLASNGHILGTATALSVCRTLSIRSRIALVLQLLFAAAGLVLGFLWLMKGPDGLLLPALLFAVASALLSWLAPLVRRI